jgi:hypothetical protein
MIPIWIALLIVLLVCALAIAGVLVVAYDARLEYERGWNAGKKDGYNDALSDQGLADRIRNGEAL